MRSLPFLLLLASCATGGTVERRANNLTLRIATQNWYVDAVSVFCAQARVGYVPGLEMGGTYRKRIPVNECPDLVIVAHGFNRTSYTYPLKLSVGPGDELCINFPMFLRLTTIINCTRRT